MDLNAWFRHKKWTPFPFQLECWKAMQEQKSGLLNAPTGSGKTFALMLPMIRSVHHNKSAGLKALWITPIRALSLEIYDAGNSAIKGLKANCNIAIRTGDTLVTERTRQKQNPPDILITTPESIHVLMSSPGYSEWFSQLEFIVIDEWHELLGSKRGVLMELALSRFKTICPKIKIWGISATIGNMEQAVEVLFGDWYIKNPDKISLVKAEINKELIIETIFPNEIERFPWSGHIGIRLLPKLLPIIYNSQSTLIFTNTRGQAEIWYQKILEADPELSGLIAIHHGSLSKEVRQWVENALHSRQIKAAVCTSSLDLGVDFRPVDTVVQIGSPKGIARFIQRAGRSGHQPGATSKIYFLPTHSLEILEGAALKTAIQTGVIEERIPYLRSFDVLVQYLITLAVSDGFFPDQIFEEVKSTFCFQGINRSEWEEVLKFCENGGAFEVYEDFHKIGKDRHGKYRIRNKRLAVRHRLSIGTIVGDNSLQVRYLNGKNLGNIEEYFISRLNVGDRFWFGGKSLQLVQFRGNIVYVKKAKSKKGITPSWMGSRMPLSSQLSDMIRKVLDHYIKGYSTDKDLQLLKPLFDIQIERSKIPDLDSFLIEYFHDREGYHLVMYPFEGRLVHEGLGALVAFRLSQIQSQSFSIAMNDYGFELLSEKAIPIETALTDGLLSTYRLETDIWASVNAVEMAKKKFRDIASIAGLVFKGFPGKQKKDKHLQSSYSLLFDVFNDYNPNHLLYLQAYDEVLTFQLEESRMRKALNRIANQKKILMTPPKATPFSFPIIADRLGRERISSEKLTDRIIKMKLQLEK